MAYRIGTLTGGRPVGLLAAAFWAFSPLYLSVIGLLATGGHEEACALGAFVLFGICRLCFRPSEAPLPLAGLIGLAAGLGFWSSLLSAPYLLVGAFGLAIARPRLLLTRIPWVGIAGFLLGSLPFWIWEIQHDFLTFTFFEGQGVGIFDQLLTRIYQSLIVLFRWGRRILSLSNPFQEPLDLMVALFWVLVLAFSSISFFCKHTRTAPTALLTG
jgi:uncharacterized Tic20 family protein